MRVEEKFLEKFILARGRTMTLSRMTNKRRVNANFIHVSFVWPASPTRVWNESRHLEKLFHSKIGGLQSHRSNRNRKTGRLIDLLFLPFVFVSLLPKGETFIPYRVIKVGAGGRAIWKIDSTNVTTYPWLGDSRTTRSRCTCPRPDAVFNRSRRKLYLVSTFFREFKHSLLFQIL